MLNSLLHPDEDFSLTKADGKVKSIEEIEKDQAEEQVNDDTDMDYVAPTYDGSSKKSNAGDGDFENTTANDILEDMEVSDEE